MSQDQPTYRFLAKDEQSPSMSNSDRTQLFDKWAKNYDESVGSLTQDFPFDGYDLILDEVVRIAAVTPGMRILDLGIGTGNLALRFTRPGCLVWGVDFSAKMLAATSAKLPQVKLIQADLLADWPPELQQRFDRIVSAYVLHEFDLAKKVSLLQRLAQYHLNPNGRIVIADIAFPTVTTRAEAHQRWLGKWDEAEYYWAADETFMACEKVSLEVSHMQLSSCGGVFVVEPTQIN